MRLVSSGMIALGVLALASCGGEDSSGGASQFPVPSQTPAPAATLLFADEFDSGTLNREMWNVEGPAFWVNHELQAYVDEVETISFANPDGAEDGALVLKPVYRPGFLTPTARVTDFVSGRINTRDNFDVTFGRIAARLRVPDGS
ncbi:MAG TPA: hypothetical protein DCS24_02155, partial [Erythrobacter sp.]|nr:hypothetical protein [Erythrobacter sp.]